MQAVRQLKRKVASHDQWRGGIRWDILQIVIFVCFLAFNNVHIISKVPKAGSTVNPMSMSLLENDHHQGGEVHDGPPEDEGRAE